MKKLKKLFIALLFIFPLITITSCDPFDEIYLKLAMDIEFSTPGFGPEFEITETFCLSDFEDYNDNKDNIEEIQYVSSAYITIDATSGLSADSLTMTLYQEDGATILFDYTIPNFVAEDYINNPLEITLTQQQIANMNAYLTDPQVDKCFVATLAASNVQPSTTQYFLTSKIDLLTELKIKP